MPWGTRYNRELGWVPGPDATKTLTQQWLKAHAYSSHSDLSEDWLSGLLEASTSGLGTPRGRERDVGTTGVCVSPGFSEVSGWSPDDPLSPCWSCPFLSSLTIAARGPFLSDCTACSAAQRDAGLRHARGLALNPAGQHSWSLCGLVPVTRPGSPLPRTLFTASATARKGHGLSVPCLRPLPGCSAPWGLGLCRLQGASAPRLPFALSLQSCPIPSGVPLKQTAPPTGDLGDKDE